MEKIAYEPHPVSAERKQELRRQGLTIIDARFKPVEVAEAEAPAAEAAPAEAEAPRRGRPPRAESAPTAE